MACVHLRCHTSHSSFGGATTPKSLAKAVKELGMTSAAITDVGTTAGVVQWQKACEAAGIHAIYGMVVWLAPENPTSRTDLEGGVFLVDEPGSLLLYARDKEGWANLSRLSSIGSRSVLGHPRVGWDDLRVHAGGLQVLVPFDHGRLDETIADRLDELWPGQWGIEVFDQGEGWEPARRQERAPFVGRAPYGEVGTNAVRYLVPTDVVALHALRCVGLGASLDAPGWWVPTSDQAWLCPEVEMRARLGDGPVDATVRFAEELRYSPKAKGYHFPKSEPPAELDAEGRWRWLQDWFPLPKSIRGEPIPRPEGLAEGAEVDAWCAITARIGLRARLDADPELDRALYAERLERELGMIREMGFSAYLLIVAEFIVWAKDERIPVGPGRGSVAGSLVAWAMRITEVDSIRFTLLFERFLNPARVSMPDVDVDFGRARREEVIEHMRVRYGRDHVGQISNFGQFKPKSALKDILRGLSVPFQEANRLTGSVDDDKTPSLLHAIDTTSSLKKRLEFDPVFRRAVRIASMLVRAKGSTDKPDPFLRSRGVHAAGVVVAPNPLSTYAPVLTDAESGRDVLAVDMDGTEGLGLIKFDFLGLKTLDVIEEALDHIEAKTGARPDLDRVPFDDPSVFTLLSSGDVDGLFQVESSGMRQYLVQLQPDHVEDVIAMLALYRPGPLGSGMVEDFIERKRGRQETVHLHPLLEPVLRSTYGVLVYQESILQAAQVLAGYSLGHADLLRRAIGKKKPEEIAAQKASFIDGCGKNGISEEEARRIFGLIEKFAEYGFNRSHSAAYGLITYRTAWLKAHHRAAFLAACASWEGGDHAQLAQVLDNARSSGIGVLPPDVIQSATRFSVEEVEGKESIRYGLGAIDGLGDAALMALRAVHRTDLSDLGAFFDRVPLDRRKVESLAAAGALDRFGVRRDFCAPLSKAYKDALAVTEKEAEKAKKKEEKKKAKAQVSLFMPPASPPPSPPVFSEVVRSCEVPAGARWTWADRLRKEEKAIGLVLSPAFSRWGDLATSLRTHTIVELGSIPSSRIAVAIVGRVRAIYTRVTRTGSTMGFVQLGDDTGITEATLFSGALFAAREVLKVGATVVVKGALDRPGDKGGVLVAGSVEDLDEITARSARLIRVGWSGRPLPVDPLEVDAALVLHPGPCPVRVNAADIDADLVSRLSSRTVLPDGPFFDTMEKTFGMPGVVRAIR